MNSSSTPSQPGHGDFKQIEASREDWDTSSSFRHTKTADPEWQFGDGANRLASSSTSTDTKPSSEQRHVVIDPLDSERPAAMNYKLLISAIAPRPIAFLSTRSADGKTLNLAPFSYFNVVTHDPPLFAVSFACRGLSHAKDSLRNAHESGEGVINIISEHFIEAANATSINAPYGVSEWDVSGLTPVYDCETVRAPRVKEAVFSIEAKVESVREVDSKANPGTKSAVLVLFEGTRFWAREDAVNEERNMIDPAILRPMGRLGGITYSRTTEALELPRPDFDKSLGGHEGFEKLQQSRKQ